MDLLFYPLLVLGAIFCGYIAFIVFVFSARGLERYNAALNRKSLIKEATLQAQQILASQAKRAEEQIAFLREELD